MTLICVGERILSFICQIQFLRTWHCLRPLGNSVHLALPTAMLTMLFQWSGLKSTVQHSAENSFLFRLFIDQIAHCRK